MQNILSCDCPAISEGCQPSLMRLCMGPQGAMAGYGNMGGMGANMVSAQPSSSAVSIRSFLRHILLLGAAACKDWYNQRCCFVNMQGHMGGYGGGMGGRGGMGGYGGMQAKMSPQMGIGGMGGNYGGGSGAYNQMQQGSGYGPAYSEGSGGGYGEVDPSCGRSSCSFLHLNH